MSIAAITLWVIANKTRLGRLPDLRGAGFSTLAAMFRHHGFVPLPLDAETAEEAAGLPAIHADPFDRALVAAARRTGRTILTRDGIIARYGVPVAW